MYHNSLHSHSKMVFEDSPHWNSLSQQGKTSLGEKANDNLVRFRRQSRPFIFIRCEKVSAESNIPTKIKFILQINTAKKNKGSDWTITSNYWFFSPESSLDYQ